MAETPCGRVGRNPISEIAHRAAVVIVERRGSWAVSLAPDGLVAVERFDSAVPDEVIGTYTAEPGLLQLWRMVRDDLTDTVRERNVGVPKRRVVYRGRTTTPRQPRQSMC